MTVFQFDSNGEDIKLFYGAFQLYYRFTIRTDDVSYTLADEVSLDDMF